MQIKNELRPVASMQEFPWNRSTDRNRPKCQDQSVPALRWRQKTPTDIPATRLIDAGLKCNSQRLVLAGSRRPTIRSSCYSHFIFARSRKAPTAAIHSSRANKNPSLCPPASSRNCLGSRAAQHNVGAHGTRGALASSNLLFCIYVYTLNKWTKTPRKKTEILQSAVFHWNLPSNSTGRQL